LVNGEGKAAETENFGCQNLNPQHWPNRDQKRQPDALSGGRPERNPYRSGMQKSLVGLSRIQRVGMKDSLKVGKTLSIEAGESIELVCGSSKILLTPNAIHLDSPDIHLLGGRTVNFDGRITNINNGVAAGANIQGPDDPEEAPLHAIDVLTAPEPEVPETPEIMPEMSDASVKPFVAAEGGAAEVG